MTDPSHGSQTPGREMSDVETGATSAPVAMDLSVLGNERPHLGLDDLVWPTNYKAYHALSRTLIDSLVDTIRNLDPGDDAAAVIRAKTYDIITDLAFVARLAFDIANARQADRDLSFSVKDSPMLALLANGGDPTQSQGLRIWHHPIDLRKRTRLRKRLRRARSQQRAILAGAGQIDIHNRNNLVNNLIDTKQQPAVDWPVTNLDWDHGHYVPAPLAESVAEIGRTFARVTARFIEEPALRETLNGLGYHLVFSHLAKSWSDFKTFEKHIQSRPMGAMLISGTPKHLGRLAGWLYRRTGRPVIRCAHGGERAFFADYEWGLAEFPDCDTYYAHSVGERDALGRRLSSGKTKLIEPEQSIDFRTLGSPHHQKLLCRSRTLRRREPTGTVIYVAGGYLGERFGDFPNRKPPDILYLDWQINLIRTLKSLGYRVVVKLHPAGIAREARYLAYYADAVLEGIFDPATTTADAFVFDFAGTAFFDTLATDAPMLFADMAVRPFDSTVFADLLARCPVVPATIDGRGRFRISRDQLGETLASALKAETCPTGFHDRYFGS